MDNVITDTEAQNGSDIANTVVDVLTDAAEKFGVNDLLPQSTDEPAQIDNTKSGAETAAAALVTVEKNMPSTTASEQNLSGHDDSITPADDKQSRIAMAKKTFDLLFGNVTGDHWNYLWTKQNKRTIPFLVTDPNARAKMATSAIELNDQGFDVYVGVNVGDEPLSSNKRYVADLPKDPKPDEPPAKLVTVQTATVTDIDTLGGGHVNTGKKKYPPTFDAAKSFLPFELSLLVNSGYGLHGYAIYAEPVVITDDTREQAQNRNEKFLSVIRNNAGEFGNVVDGVGDLPRILRVPGTFNYKAGVNNAAPLCRLVEVNDVRFTPADLDAKLDALIPKQQSMFDLPTVEKSATPTENQSAREIENKSVPSGKTIDLTAAGNTSSKQLEDEPEYNLWRAEKMLEVIPIAQMTRDEWLHVGMSLKNNGNSVDMWIAWSRPDTRFKDGECEKLWEGFNRNGLTIATIKEIAQRYGYDEQARWREWHVGKNNSSPKRAETAGGGEYEKLFDGLKPIKICAGSILHAVDDNDKFALESLFVDKDFTAFALIVTCDDDKNMSAQVYSQTQIVLTAEQVKDAVTWLVGKLIPIFKSNYDALKKFIVGRLQAANALAALRICDNDTFWGAVTAQAEVVFDGKIFDFDAKFRRELIACAKHSKGFLKSLLRFDFQRLENFLQRSFTDVVCAELLIDVQRDLLRFDTAQGTWYTWRGNCWQAVNIKTREPLYALWTPLARKAALFADRELFRKICERDEFAINNPDCGKSKTPAGMKFNRLERAVKIAAAKVAETRQIEQSRKIDNILVQAAGLPETKITTKELDTNKFLFNTANVTINLETMDTYTARQADLITLSTPTVYEPAATSADWTKFLETAIPDTELRDWLQRFFGYCLSGDTSNHLFLFIHGVGGSGKTTFLNAIGGALGDYAGLFSVDAICISGKLKDGEEPSPALAELRACRLARSSETQKNRRLDESSVKRWTGADLLNARELHKPPFKFKPSFKLVVDGNFALRVSDINDDGLRRRLRIAPFNNPPSPDKVDTTLESKLSTPTARSAILNWLLDGWRKYREKGLRDVPAVMQTALDSYYAANDTISDFLEAHNFTTCDLQGKPLDKNNPSCRVAVLDAWNCYKEWQRKTPMASILSRADFVSAVLLATEKDGVAVRPIMHKDYFVGCTMETDPQKHFAPPT